ncbi:MAG: aldo/keto reductase [Minisyncoccia bacterium]|jgi:D-threo-aldose 1-dehydrogenase
MQTKLLPGTNITVPIVGLGTGSLGIPDQNLTIEQYSPGPNWKNYMDRDLGIATVLAALEAGIRFIDTAPWYGRGFAEETVGEALRQAFRTHPGLQDEVVVATKIGHLRPGDDYDFSYDAAMRSFEGSQKRLGIERFRLVHLHDPMGQSIQRVMGSRGVFGAMRSLQEQSLIDFVSVGANDSKTATTYISTGKFNTAIVVGAWSLINQSARDHILPAAEKSGTGLIAANALERGILATGFQKEIRYQERRFDNPELIARIEEIKALCQRYQIPLAAAAIQWCVRNPHFGLVIPGARTPEQVLENTSAGEAEIEESFWQELAPLVQTWDCIVE